MIWIDSSDVSGKIAGFTQIDRMYFSDLWKLDHPLPGENIIGACRGVLIGGSNFDCVIRGTWHIVDEENPAFSRLDDEFRPGEIFGWVVTVEKAAEEAVDDQPLDAYFGNASQVTSYEDAFGPIGQVKGFSLAYEAVLGRVVNPVPSLCVVLFDFNDEPVLKLATKPDGRIVCQRL